jgi:hypothetical protein
MNPNKLNIEAVSLLKLSEQLQSIINELNVMINAPEKLKKISKKDEIIAKHEAIFEKKYGKARKTN